MEKHEIFRLTPAQLHSNLNILILKLASTNRETREQLKFFRDSGGNIVQHFPPENEPEKHKALKDQFPNLDMLGNDKGHDEDLLKTSLGNLGVCAAESMSGADWVKAGGIFRNFKCRTYKQCQSQQLEKHYSAPRTALTWF
jgi:hypothetical protein